MPSSVVWCLLVIGAKKFPNTMTAKPWNSVQQAVKRHKILESLEAPRLNVKYNNAL